MRKGNEIAEGDFFSIREAISRFNPSPRVEPNQKVPTERVFTPDTHRGVLDLSRQLIVGNRGMGKSFWTHALLEQSTLDKLKIAYSIPKLDLVDAVIGYNASEKREGITPTTEKIKRAMARGVAPKLVWQAVVLNAVESAANSPWDRSFDETLQYLSENDEAYEIDLSRLDDQLINSGRSVLVLFDALDRLDENWDTIANVTKALFQIALGVRSFRSVRLKIFIRSDQFAMRSQFDFPDSSKLENDAVKLQWKSVDLYSLLLFEIARNPEAKKSLQKLATNSGAGLALDFERMRSFLPEIEINGLINRIAGEFMGAGPRRGRVYSWLPLHLSDAQGSCSPRTFLTAWQTAASHKPEPLGQAVDHRGLQDGVRVASQTRVNELREEYPWINTPLESLRGKKVPISRNDLLKYWKLNDVVRTIVAESSKSKRLPPVGIEARNSSPDRLIDAMESIGVIEVRSNGKINVPDIFRTAVGILRLGGVAIPKKK